MKALAKGVNVEKLVVDWVDVDESAVKRQLEDGQWEEYEGIIEKVAGYGDKIVFVKAE